jgi:murein DD-endopeptidase / murein LD-carboxypeptidase
MKILTTALALLTAMSASAAANSDRLQNIVTEAKTWQGTPYRYGGENRNGIDCSHFVFSIYSKIVPGFKYRMAREYLSDSSFREAAPPHAGDLIVFPGYRGASDHVGIVTDSQKMKFIGSQTSTGVAETSFAATSYWGKRPYRIMHLKSFVTQAPELTPGNLPDREMAAPKQR